jgi:carboxypeptidase C (cathepsin A)
MKNKNPILKKSKTTLISIFNKRGLEVDPKITYYDYQKEMKVQKYTTDNSRSALAGSSPGGFQQPDFSQYLVTQNNDRLFTENNNNLIIE